MTDRDKLEVEKSYLEFHVTGVDSTDLSHGIRWAISETMEDWGTAFEWLQERESFGGKPHLLVNKITTFKNSKQTATEKLFEADWKDLDMDAKTIKRIEELEKQIVAAKKEMYELNALSLKFDAVYQELGKILHSHSYIEDEVVIG